MRSRSVCTTQILQAKVVLMFPFVSYFMAKMKWYFTPVKPRVARLKSEAPHSAIVEYGATRADGSEMPSRPFMQTSVAETDFEQEFLDGYRLYQDVNAAFEGTARALHETIKDLIQDNRWEWDRVTYRRNGQIVDSPRDIVDKGELLRSQKLEID